ncbi:MAG: hypothetical protein GY856_04635 [bacterium]|nr:hypothetical protein [bacterium]
MMSSLSHREQAIRELADLPPRLNRRAKAGKTRVPIAEVRRVLDLPEPPYRELLAADRWLAGGAVMRWLSRDLSSGGTEQSGDYDFFLPSLEAMNGFCDQLLATGFTFRCFRSPKILCPLCGGPGKLVPRGKWEGSLPPADPIRCPDCGEIDTGDVDNFPVERLLRLSPEVIREYGVWAVEFVSPQGHRVHLSARALKPTIEEILAGHDFSIVQFALDDESLCFGAYAWTDLLRRRLRIVDPDTTYLRVRKFLRLGFRPYAGTALWLLRRGVRLFTWRLFRRLRPGA